MCQNKIISAKCSSSSGELIIIRVNITGVFTASEMTMNRFICPIIFLAQDQTNLHKCLRTCGTALFLTFPNPESSASHHFEMFDSFQKLAWFKTQTSLDKKAFEQRKSPASDHNEAVVATPKQSTHVRKRSAMKDQEVNARDARVRAPT